MYRLVALARAVDERMWILNRAGRIPFVISGQGHEGAQVGIAWAFEKGHDWIAPFYRSIATCLTFGMSAARHHDRPVRHGRRPVVGRPPDAGPLRQPRAQPRLGVARRSRPSSCTPSGIALAAKIRKTGQVAMTSMGEGSSNQGDVHEGLNFAAIHKLPFVFVVENNGYAISVPAGDAGRRCRTSRTGRRATGSRASSSTARTCWPATRRRGMRSRGRAPATGRPSSRPRSSG